MATTPRLKLPYPNENADPWFDGFKGFVESVDEALYAAREDRNIVITGGGTVTFDAGTGVLTWAADINLLAPVTGYLWSVPAGSVTLNDGELAYITLSRNPQSTATYSLNKATKIPTEPNGDSQLLFGVRMGTRVYLRDGKVINSGESFSVYESSAVGGAGGGGTPGGSEGEVQINYASTFTGATNVKAGSGYLSVGTTPATAGAVRYANVSYTAWRNANNTGNVNGIGVDGSDILRYGYGGSAAPAAHVFHDGTSFGWYTSGAYAFLSDASGNINARTSLAIGSNTASTGSMRYANGFTLNARNAANSSDVAILTKDSSEILWIGDKTNLASYVLQASGNGFARATTHYWEDPAGATGFMSLTSAGLAVPSTISAGTNPSTTGDVRLKGSFSIKYRNDGNTADLDAFYGDQTYLTIGNQGTSVLRCYTGNAYWWHVGGVLKGILDGNGVWYGTAVATGGAQAASATTGDLRFVSAGSAKFRNAGNTADLHVFKIDTSNNIWFGSDESQANSVPEVRFYPSSAVGFGIGGNTKAWLTSSGLGIYQNANFGIYGATASFPSVGGGLGVLAVGDVGTAPNSLPTSGFVTYSQGGVAKILGAGLGVMTTAGQALPSAGTVRLPDSATVYHVSGGVDRLSLTMGSGTVTIGDSTGIGGIIHRVASGGIIYNQANGINLLTINESGCQFNTSTFSLGGGVGVIGIADATTAPSTNPTGGAVIYSEGGAWKVRTTSGVWPVAAPSAAMAALDIDCSKSSTFYKILAAGANAVTFSNFLDGQSISVALTGAGSTVTWPAGTKWAGGTTPTQTSSGTDVYTFVKINSVVYGSVAQAFA